MIEQLLSNPLFRNVSAGELRKDFEGLTYKVKNYTKGERIKLWQPTKKGHHQPP